MKKRGRTMKLVDYKTGHKKILTDREFKALATAYKRGFLAVFQITEQHVPWEELFNIEGDEIEVDNDIFDEWVEFLEEERDKDGN